MTTIEIPEHANQFCDRCLGRRIVGATGKEPQEEAGAALRAEHKLATPDVCGVCENRWDVDQWMAAIDVALEGYEGTTFQIGTIFPTPCELLEKSLPLNPEIGDSLRTETNRLLGPLIAEKTGMELRNDARPDLVIQVDTRFWHATVSANGVYISGRYTKTRRDVPQTHWPCKTCQGTGCYRCDDTGVMYAESVEDSVSVHARALFEAPESAFHGAGREDIDAIMVGTGRPFVLELKNPKKRTIDLAQLEALVNAESEASGVGITDMKPCDKDLIQELKAGEHDKEYVAHCETDEDVTPEQIAAATQVIAGAMLEQRTPDRVSHRRADLVRNRRIHSMTVEKIDDPRHFTVRLRADSGAYIKEMVHGDEGRTTPNLADALGVPCRVALLDVTAIYD